MAFIGFRAPFETSRLYSAIDVPGERETFHHVTILNFGKEMTAEDIGEAFEAAHEVVRSWQPFTVRTSVVSCFPAGDNGVPIICPVESEEIHQLWAELGEAFDSAKIPFSKKFPVYKPHVTLAYAPKPIEDRRIMPPIEWGAHELVLWGGSAKDLGVTVHMPFSLRAASILNSARYRVIDLGGRELLKAKVVARFKGRNRR
jgi:hypothetical protein